MRMLEKSSFNEKEKKMLIQFINYTEIESIDQFKQYCKLIESGRKKCWDIDFRAYSFYSSRCIWNNVLHQKGTQFFIPIVMYSLIHHGTYLLRRPRTVYYLLKGMIKK